MTLKSARKYRKMSQYDLARESGVSVAMISRLEAGLREPSFRYAWKIARALQVKPEEIFKH